MVPFRGHYLTGGFGRHLLCNKRLSLVDDRCTNDVRHIAATVYCQYICHGCLCNVIAPFSSARTRLFELSLRSVVIVLEMRAGM